MYPRHAIGFILYYLAFVCLVIVSDAEREKKRLIQGAEEGESLRHVVGNSHSSVDVKERQLVGMDGEMVVVDWVDEPPAHEVLGQNTARWCQTREIEIRFVQSAYARAVGHVQTNDDTVRGTGAME